MRKLFIPLLFLAQVLTVSAQEADSIIDVRDGQVYKVVKIGQQWWMQENLNIGKMINGTQDTADNGVIEKYCYDNLESNCDVYGGLYQWDEMMDYNPSDNGNPGITRGICPAGWHLPTDIEWTELTDFLGGDSVAGGKLKEAGNTHWYDPNTGATNESGFTALPAHSRNFDPYFYIVGINTFFWSSTKYNNSQAWYRSLSYNSSEVNRNNELLEYGFSIRCLNDSSQFEYLIISNKNFGIISKLYFMYDHTINKIVLFNSSADKTITVNSIYSVTPVYNINKSSTVLFPGDSIHLTINFNPPAIGIYLDTLHIESDDPYNPLITIPLEGIYPTEVCGVITENDIWTKANSPYFINCNLAIDGEVTLTIEPGVTLIMDSMKRITVDGTLIANGEAGDTIVFTNYLDDKFDEVYIRSTGKCRLSCFKIEGALTALKAENDSLAISHGTIQSCVDGIKISTDTYLKLENLRIVNNSGDGIKTGPDAKGLIQNCVIEGNLNGIWNDWGAFDIIGNTIKSNNNYGIYYTGAISGYHIENNIINNNSKGLWVTNGSVTNNVINYNNDYGVELNGGTIGTNFNLNKVQNNYGDGIRGCFSSLKFNQIDNNTGNGIIGSDFEISGNKIIKNGLNGILSSGLNTIENNIICYNTQDGINHYNNSSIRFNDILFNGDDGIQTSALPIINSNNIYGNENYNVHTTKQSNETIDAENNYWGVTGLAEISNTIYDYYDDGVTVKVDFEPFLTEPISSSLFDFAENKAACYGDPVPDLIASGEIIEWYSDEEYNNLIHTGDTFSTGNTEIGVYTYYVTQKISDSIVLNDTAALIISSIPTVSNIEKTYETTCNSNDGAITITAIDENPLLYSVDGGNNYFGNGGVFTGLSNGNYLIVVKNSNGCIKSGGTVEIISEGVIPPAPVAGKDSTYCSGDEIYDIYAIASSGGTLTWYSDPGLNNIIVTGTSYSPSGLTETTSFYVTETYNNCESPSTTVTIKIKNDPPYEDEKLCLITIDLATGKNLLVWEKTPDVGINSYNLYRETSVIGQYELIGNIPYEKLSVFIDSTAKPEERQYLYKITVVDNCGGESGKSSYHKPLFLQYVGSTGGVNLQWSDYEIEGGDISFITYEIFRGDDQFSLEKIADVSASLDRYTDTYSEALTRKFYYRIAGVKAEACIPTGNIKGVNVDYSRSMSNLSDNEIVSVQDYQSIDQLYVCPNPYSETTTLIFNNPEGDSYRLYIMDLSGKVCRIEDNISVSEYVLERGELKEGFYFIELRGPEVYRGKVVIE